MRVEDIGKVEWVKGSHWRERWYNTELCFRAFKKGINPLTDLFTKHGLTSLTLNTQWYHDKEDDEFWGKDRETAVRSGLKLFTKLVSQTNRYVKRLEQVLDRVKKVNAINDKLLLKIEEAFYLGWFIFFADLGDSLGPFIEDYFREKGLGSKEVDKIKDYLFSFNRLLAYRREETALRSLFKLYQKKYDKNRIKFEELDASFRKRLADHTKEFTFITCLDINTSPWGPEDFYNKIFELPLIQAKRFSQKLSVKMSKILSKEDNQFLKLAQEHTFLDNYAADLYEKLDYLLLYLLSKQFLITFQDLTWYSWEEIRSLVKRGEKVPEKDLKIRKKYRVMAFIDGKLGIFYGQENYKKVLVYLNKLEKLKVDKFRGSIASRGMATGIVRIVRGATDNDKVKNGDILVATTTHPELMPAILRCSAIVTEVGGITSHAAIISRELKIPCIVATHVATQVLKDGDMIEVDANQGIVKILGNG